jgi:GT2 family glycosyltransferase
MQNDSLDDAAIEVSECHILTFSREAIELEQSVNYLFGGDIALHVLVHPQTNSIVINNCRKGAWQEQSLIHIPKTESLPLQIALLFHDDEVLVAVIGARGARPVSRKVELTQGPVKIIRGGMTGLQVIAAPARIPLKDAVIDFCGGLAGGVTMLCGWTTHPWPENAELSVSLDVAGERLKLPAEILLYDRPDLGSTGTGYILSFRLPEGAMPEIAMLAGIKAEVEVWEQRLVPHPQTLLLEAEQARSWLADLLPSIRRGRVSLFRDLISRPIFAGVDTLASLPVPCRMEADIVYDVPGKGLMVSGWFLDPMDAIGSIRLCSGLDEAAADLRTRMLRMERPDVQAAFAAQYDLADARLGFLAYAPLRVNPGNMVYARIELKSGEVGFKPLPAAARAGVSAIRRILQDLRLTTEELQPVCDDVLGEAIVAINRARLARPIEVGEVRFGQPPAQPRASIIVPLYGRLDFVEYQCALFSEGGISADELIYVLDEPDRKAELLDLAEACHAKFGVPLRVVLPRENRGFGPASNLGLDRARGRHVCFLNSDIFPASSSWLDHLTGTLDADPEIGVAGALCLFADGSVQHAGMAYEAVPRFGGWLFPKHPGKGMKPELTPGRLRDVPGITGACMVMRRDLAIELGGFDPDYIIGDFEDADLCNRIRAKGLRCVLDQAVTLYHLERQSQGDQSTNWRMNLTLLNAWTFNQRWGQRRELGSD